MRSCFLNDKRVSLTLGKAFAHDGAYIVEGGDHDGYSQHLGAGAAVIEQVDVLLQQETDTAAADETDDGGHAHVDIPAVKGVGDIGRHNLGNDRIHDGLQAVGACGLNGLQRTSGDAFHLFRIQLGQAHDSVQPESEHAGERADAHGDDKDDGHHQGFDRGKGVKESTRNVVNDQANGQCVFGFSAQGGKGAQGSANCRRSPQGECGVLDLVKPINNPTQDGQISGGGNRGDGNVHHAHRQNGKAFGSPLPEAAEQGPHGAVTDKGGDEGIQGAEDLTHMKEEVGQKGENTKPASQLRAKQRHQLRQGVKPNQNQQANNRQDQGAQQARCGIWPNRFFRRNRPTKTKRAKHRDEQNKKPGNRQRTENRFGKRSQPIGKLEGNRNPQQPAQGSQRNGGQGTAHRFHQVAGGDKAERDGQDRADGGGQQSQENGLDDFVPGVVS